MGDPESQRGASIVEIELEAKADPWEVAPGRTVAGYAYNGRVPGPTIEAERGDVIVVRLTNHLPEPTTMHWHGLRVPAGVDGTERTQHPVAPGEQFEYRFTVPDAGTFWYHPHVNETVQMEMGLYGAIAVRDPSEPRIDGEKVLVFDDLDLDAGGRLAPFGGDEQLHDGRLGSLLLLNGRAAPELRMAAGQTERWRLINASSARYVVFSLGGRGFRVIASDGGLLTAPETAERVLLTPGERADLAVGPFAEGDEIALEGLPYDRGHGMEGGGRYALLRVGPPAATVARIPEHLRDIEPIAAPDVTPNRVLRLTGRMGADGVQFGFNDQMHYVDEPVRVGDLQVWKIVNETGMDHPFHLHGFFFQVLRARDVPIGVEDETMGAPQWKDTVNVPARDSVTIAWLPDDRPGGWMYHCHILEHHAVGMMGHFDVVRAADAP